MRVGTRRKILGGALVGVALSGSSCAAPSAQLGAEGSAPTPARRQGDARGRPSGRSGAGDDGRGRSAFERAVARYCRAEVACDDGSDSDARACISDYDGLFEEFLAEYGSSCVAAYTRYLTCLATSYETSCDDRMCVEAIHDLAQHCTARGQRRRIDANGR